MYIPDRFREQDIGVLQDFMERFAFATLVTQKNGEIIASHLPFILDWAPRPYGTLRAHIAKRNAQFDHIQCSSDALVIFQGPHSYISPMWYADHQNVPTWNYAVVHAYGIPRLLGEPDLIDVLQRLVHQHEGALPQRWDFDPGQSWIREMLPEIAAFEVPISNLQGKFKLNQNRTASDRKGVIDTLIHSEDPLKRAIANLMTARSIDDK
jgi:transcriptional regulator